MFVILLGIIKHINATTCLPYAEYEAKTMMYAEALLMEYHIGDVLPDALYGTW